MQTIEAIVDANGAIKLLSDIRLPKNRRALLTILDEEPKHVDVESKAAPELRKEKLFAAFRKAQEAGLFKNIDDPVAWQRKLRDEWD